MLHKSSILASVVCGGVALGCVGLVAWQKSHASAGETGAQQAGDAPDQERASVNHFKQILLAFHNYYSVNDHLPPKAIYGADGEPKLSWRVALLPWLEQNELFQSFHQDEPWDSPHNKALIAKMPDTFTMPGSPAGVGMTRIRVFEGPGTLFDGSRGMQFKDILDGTSNTIAIVAAREAVPWTRPGDLPFAPGKPLPALDDSIERGVLAGIADGSVRIAPRGDQAFWKKLITPAGNEMLIWPELPGAPRPRPVPPTEARPTPRALMLQTPNAALAPQVTINTAPAGPISPELEARLRAIEAKLDRVLRRLEAVDKQAGPQ